MNLTGARWSLSGAEAVLLYVPYARVMISMLIGSFTRNRSTNAITPRTMPIIKCRASFCLRPSYPNPVVAAL